MTRLYPNTLWTLVIVTTTILLSGCGGNYPDSDGKMFRGTLQRTGVYDADGARRLGRVKLYIQLRDCGWHCASSPVVCGGVAYVGRGNCLCAVDIERGEELWRFETGDFVGSSPAIAGEFVYFGSGDHNLYALNAKTGQKLWEFGTEDTIMSSPAIRKGVVYFGSFDGHLYAVSARRGKLVWKFGINDEVFSSPAINDGVLYFGSGDHNLYALSTETGEEIWRFTTGDTILSSPAVANGKVYFSGLDGNLYCLDASTGKELWRFKAGRWLVSSPAVANGVVYLGSDDRHLYAVDAATGKEKWRFDAGRDIVSSPAVAGGVIYFGCNDHRLYAVDSKTGRKLWRFKGEGAVFSSPTVSGSIVCFSSEYGHLYGLEGGEPSEGAEPKGDIEIPTEWVKDDSGRLIEREVDDPRILQNAHIFTLGLEAYYYHSGGYYPIDTFSYCSTGYAGKGTMLLDLRFSGGPHLRTSFKNPYGDTLPVLRIGHKDSPDWSPELAGQLVWIPLGPVSTESGRNVPETLATGYKVYLAGPTGFYRLVLEPPQGH